MTHVAYFGGNTEETKQSNGGSEISKVGFCLLLRRPKHYLSDVRGPWSVTDNLCAIQATEAADDSIKRTDAKYQEARERRLSLERNV